MVDMGSKLRELRLNKNLSQRQVGELVGVSKAMISSYETDIREPSLVTMKKLATLYGVSTDFLLGLEKEPSISIKGLSPKQIAVVQAVIDSYHEK